MVRVPIVTGGDGPVRSPSMEVGAFRGGPDARRTTKDFSGSVHPMICAVTTASVHPVPARLQVNVLSGFIISER